MKGKYISPASRGSKESAIFFILYVRAHSNLSCILQIKKFPKITHKKVPTIELSKKNQ